MGQQESGLSGLSNSRAEAYLKHNGSFRTNDLSSFLLPDFGKNDSFRVKKPSSASGKKPVGSKGPVTSANPLTQRRKQSLPVSVQRTSPQHKVMTRRKSLNFENLVLSEEEELNLLRRATHAWESQDMSEIAECESEIRVRLVNPEKEERTDLEEEVFQLRQMLEESNKEKFELEKGFLQMRRDSLLGTSMDTMKSSEVGAATA